MHDQGRWNNVSLPPAQLIHITYEQAFLNGVEAMVDFMRDNGGSIIGLSKDADSIKYLGQRLDQGEIKFKRDFGLEGF